MDRSLNLFPLPQQARQSPLDWSLARDRSVLCSLEDTREIPAASCTSWTVSVVAKGFSLASR